MKIPAIPIITETHIIKAVRELAEYERVISSARLRVIERAREIGAEQYIPDTWNEDGTLK